VIIFILIWVFLTIFSIIGGLFLEEIIFSYFPHTELIYFIAIVVNFYICNFLSILLSPSSLARLNKSLLFLVTGLLVLAVEIYIGYYLIFEIFGLNDKFIFEVIALLLIIFVPFGGLLFFLKSTLDPIVTHFSEFLDGIQKNTQDRFLNEAKKQAKPSKNKQLTKIENEIMEIEKILKDL